MGKRLTDCITSQYIGAANRLGSKSARDASWLTLKATMIYSSGVPFSHASRTRNATSKYCYPRVSSTWSEARRRR